jgi:hypothetical protein
MVPTSPQPPDGEIIDLVESDSDHDSVPNHDDPDGKIIDLLQSDSDDDSVQKQDGPEQPPKTAKEGRKLTDFFSMIRNVGRPKKRKNSAGDVIEESRQKKKKCGPRPKAKEPTLTAEEPPPASNGIGTTQPDESLKPKAKRTNWALPKNQAKLEKAVSDCDNDTGDAVDSNGDKLTLTVFSNTISIPYHTFKLYVTKDKGKRRLIGKHVGNKPLVSQKDQHFLADVLARMD